MTTDELVSTALLAVMCIALVGGILSDVFDVGEIWRRWRRRGRKAKERRSRERVLREQKVQLAAELAMANWRIRVQAAELEQYRQIVTRMEARTLEAKLRRSTGELDAALRAMAELNRPKPPPDRSWLDGGTITSVQCDCAICWAKRRRATKKEDWEQHTPRANGPKRWEPAYTPPDPGFTGVRMTDAPLPHADGVQEVVGEDKEI